MDPTIRTALETAHVTITLADFVNIDADGRVTLVGAGNRVLAIEPTTWRSPPFGLWAAISVADTPPDPAIVELVLAGRDGESARMPDGEGGSREVRVTQPVLFRQHLGAGLAVPAGELPFTYDLAVSFGSGLLLEPGRSYRWQVELDGRIAAAYAFFAAGSDSAVVE